MGAQFFWVRSYDTLNGWVTVYENWDPVVARDFRAHTQPGALVIADIFDMDSNRWLPRETWQQFSPGPGGGGSRTSTPWSDGGPAPPPSALPPGLTWSRLPSGDDVTLKKDYYYDAVAHVKSSHDKNAISNMLASKGLKILSYDEGAVSDGYRDVHIIALAQSDAGTVPWKVPWWVPGDSSGLVSVRTAPAKSGMPAKPPEASTSVAPFVALGGLVLAGAAGTWFLYKKKHHTLPKWVPKALRT